MHDLFTSGHFCRQKKKKKTNKQNKLDFLFIYFLLLLFLYKIKILLYLNINVYVCETPSWKLKPRPLSPTPYKHLILVKWLLRQWCAVVKTKLNIHWYTNPNFAFIVLGIELVSSRNLRDNPMLYNVCTEMVEQLRVHLGTFYLVEKHLILVKWLSRQWCIVVKTKLNIHWYTNPNFPFIELGIELVSTRNLRDNPM